MRWEDVRNAAPQQWVIIEAVDAHTEGDNRVIENIQLAEHYDVMRNFINPIPKGSFMFSILHALN